MTEEKNAHLGELLLLGLFFFGIARWKYNAHRAIRR